MYMYVLFFPSRDISYIQKLCEHTSICCSTPTHRRVAGGQEDGKGGREIDVLVSQGDEDSAPCPPHLTVQDWVQDGIVALHVLGREGGEGRGGEGSGAERRGGEGGREGGREGAREGGSNITQHILGRLLGLSQAQCQQDCFVSWTECMCVRQRLATVMIHSVQDSKHTTDPLCSWERQQ